MTFLTRPVLTKAQVAAVKAAIAGAYNLYRAMDAADECLSPGYSIMYSVGPEEPDHLTTVLADVALYPVRDSEPYRLHIIESLRGLPRMYEGDTVLTPEPEQ